MKHNFIVTYLLSTTSLLSIITCEVIQNPLNMQDVFYILGILLAKTGLSKGT